MSVTTYECTAGRLLCGHIRNELSKAQYLGRIISFHESSGFFERDFIVTLEEENKALIVDFFNRLQAANED